MWSGHMGDGAGNNAIKSRSEITITFSHSSGTKRPHDGFPITYRIGTMRRVVLNSRL